MSEASPFVSAVLLSYNCAEFIVEAVRSVLKQDCEPMEVVVSDDASEDETVAILQRELNSYHGPHRIDMRRRTSNSGSKSAHLNDVLRSVSGEIIVSFDGDDISETSRVLSIVKAFRRNPTVQAVYSSYSLIDEAGRPLGSGFVPHPSSEVNTKAWFANVDAYASGGTLAIRRSVFESFGSLDPDVYEDVVLPFRASLLGEVRYLGEELVKVRRHSKSLTQSFDMFDSVESYRSRFLWGIEQARRQRDSRLSDLRTAIALVPNHAEDLEGLREIIDASMTAAETSAGLVNPSLPVRARALLERLRKGSGRDGFGRDVFLAFAPKMYLRYKRKMLNTGRKPTRDERLDFDRW
jgi:glycosyltransferase involved in cell wall biosynthesis